MNPLFVRSVALERDGVLERVEYEDTEHYRVTRQFFAQRERMLKILLGGE